MYLDRDEIIRHIVELVSSSEDIFACEDETMYQEHAYIKFKKELYIPGYDEPAVAIGVCVGEEYEEEEMEITYEYMVDTFTVLSNVGPYNYDALLDNRGYEFSLPDWPDEMLLQLYCSVSGCDYACDGSNKIVESDKIIPYSQKMHPTLSYVK